MTKKKRGIFFTIDSLLASGIVITAVILISNFYIAQRDETNVNYASQDLVKVFSAMTVGQSSNDYVKSLIASSAITNTNNSIIEQIGDFWAENQIELAKNFTKNLTDDIIPKAYGFSILVNDDVIYSRNITVKRALFSSRKIISGISKTNPTEGFTSRVLLKGIKSKRTNAYVYFGGYEGDGNLTKKFILPKDIVSFNSSYLEFDDGGNFNLYVNGAFSGNYIKGSAGGGSMLADKWNMSNAYLANFVPGENTISVNFTSGSSYIAGGFLRLIYVTSSYNDTQIPGYEKYWFPGIDGIINLYSSIYIPGALNNMRIFLNYSSNYTTFLRLGNATVYEATSNGTILNVTISNNTLSTILDYNSLNEKTIPLRLGLKDISILRNGNADVILLTDVSGSMNERLDNTAAGVTRNCDDPLLNDPSTKRISLAKCLDKQFIDVLLNSSFGNSTNRVGLISYSGLPLFMPSAPSTIIVSTHNLSNNNASLKNEIDTYSPNGFTGICGGIRQGRVMLQNQSNSSRRKFIIVMTDGIANAECSLTDEYSTIGCVPNFCNDNSFCAGGGCMSLQCGDIFNQRAANDSIQDSCRAYNTTNATVYSIGFGPVSACPVGNQTLQSIATCGKGAFYSSSNATELAKIYNSIAQQIFNSSFSGQTINISVSLNTKLSLGSYIEYNYSAPQIQFNKIPLAFETNRFGNNISSGSLTVYANTSILEARVTSYSGGKWTDNLVVNGNTVYRLSDYGSDYQTLGDPSFVNIPISNINQGLNNITISTGLNSTVSTGGSNDSRVVYTLLLNGFSDYSSVVSKSDGCLWNISFRDSTSTALKIPSSYAGAETCSFLTKTYNTNDSLDNAVYQLLSSLDIDKDGKIELNIDENSINVDTLSISKVPSLWGPAIVEIRVWE